MAAPQFEANRQTDLTVYLNRLLEKCYKDSKCIDLESLCIVVEDKVNNLCLAYFDNHKFEMQINGAYIMSQGDRRSDNDLCNVKL